MGSSQSTEASASSSTTTTATPVMSPPSTSAAAAATSTAAGASVNDDDPSTISASEANAAKAGFDPSLHGNLSGRYRVASKSSERYFYESQPANQEGAALSNFKSNLQVGAEGAKATAAAKLIAEEVEKQGGKLTVIDNSMSKEEIRRILSETEGLNMSARRRAELSQTWRFLLASDPVQYGLDAGFLSGSVLAAASLKWPVNRHPIRLAFIWLAGFGVGLMVFPMSMLAWEEYNMRRITRKNDELFKSQREDFYRDSGTSSRTPKL